MRNLAIALLITASTAGCATSVGPDGPYFGQSDASASESQLTGESPDGVSGDAKPDPRESNDSAKSPAGRNRISRAFTCGANGAAAGLGLALYAALTPPYPQGGSLYFIPLAASAGAIIGLAMGAVGGGGEFCSWKLWGDRPVLARGIEGRS